MSEYIRFAKLPILLLAIFLIARLIMGASGVPYERGTWLFSMVLLSYLAAFFFGAFSRALKGYRWTQAVLLGVTIVLSAQIMIFLATLISYLVGADTYFNHPMALNAETAVPMGEAILRRLVTLIVNCIAGSIWASLGWLGGKMMPEPAG